MSFVKNDIQSLVSSLGLPYLYTATELFPQVIQCIRKNEAERFAYTMAVYMNF